MDHQQKVLWSEGMFLTPHHLQQAERHHDGVLHRALRALQPLSWGVGELQLNSDALTNGEVVVTRCSGLFPDGLAFDVPDVDEAPASRSIEAHFDAKRVSLPVYLAAPRVRSGAAACSPEGDADGRPTRFRRRTASVPDLNAGGNEREIDLAAKNLKVLFEGEPLDDFVTIKIAELSRNAAGTFMLNDAYIPPCLSMAASPALASILRRVLEILSTKSTELSTQRRQRSQGLVEFTMSEAANFWFLHTVNAYIPWLAHLHQAPAGAHPERVYLALAQLAGELYTFSGEGHPKEVPPYQHDALRETFAGLEDRIRQMMGTVIPTRVSPVALEKTRESLFTGRLVDDRVIEGGQLYLAVMAEVPEEKIIKEVPLKAKISSTDRVDQLIAAAMRGIVLRHLPTPPAEIPVQPGRVYFQVDKTGDHWEAVKRSRSLSLYVPPEFKGLKLELMAVKE